MLEREGMLWTWELRALPSAWKLDAGETSDDNNRTITALRLPDHRLDYLDHEGALSHGRGSVKRVDRGEFDFLSQTSGSLVVRLHGEQIRGRVELFEIQQPPHWQLTVRQ